MTAKSVVSMISRIHGDVPQRFCHLHEAAVGKKELQVTTDDDEGTCCALHVLCAWCVAAVRVCSSPSFLLQFLLTCACFTGYRETSVTTVDASGTEPALPPFSCRW